MRSRAPRRLGLLLRWPRGLLVLLIALSGQTAVVAAGPDAVWVEAIGVAVAEAPSGDPASSAVEAALREAVASVARELAPGAGLPEDPGLYVLGYEGLERTCQGGRCEVLLRVQVARAALAGALTPRSPDPAGPGRWLSLELDGVPGWTWLLRLAEALPTLPGVASVRRPGLEGTLGRIEVRTHRTAEQIAVALEARALAGAAFTCAEWSDEGLRCTVAAAPGGDAGHGSTGRMGGR